MAQSDYLRRCVQPGQTRLQPVLAALPTLSQVISGGQTGADRAALDWALHHSIPHGGWCPRGRIAADGPINARYQLKETESSGYFQRTERNIKEADKTLVFVRGTRPLGGTLLTMNLCLKWSKPPLLLYLDNDDIAGLALRMQAWIASESIHTLNIAGPSEEGAPKTYALVMQVLEHCARLPALLPPRPEAESLPIWDLADRAAWVRARYALMVLNGRTP